MRLTKYEHAAFVLEHPEGTLVVDPGSFAASLPALSGVVAIVVTHEHADHWTPDRLSALLEANPGVPVFSTAAVARAAGAPPVEVVQAGEVRQAGPFTLSFHGGTHAVIHSSIPVIENVGVLVNDTLYYGGDAFHAPEGPIEVLAVPASAPWLKIAEVMDYVLAVKPKRSFPIHEALLSPAGLALSDARIKDATEAGGGEYIPLRPGESIEL